MKRSFSVKVCIGIVVCLAIIVCALCVKIYRAEPLSADDALAQAPALQALVEEMARSNVQLGTAYRITERSLVHGKQDYIVLPCFTAKTGALAAAGGTSMWTFSMTLLSTQADASALTIKSGEVVLSPGENTTVYSLEIPPDFKQTAQDEDANRITFQNPQRDGNRSLVSMHCSASTAETAAETNLETTGSVMWNVVYRVGWQTFSSSETATFQYITNAKN